MTTLVPVKIESVIGTVVEDGIEKREVIAFNVLFDEQIVQGENTYSLGNHRRSFSYGEKEDFIEMVGSMSAPYVDLLNWDRNPPSPTF